MLKISNISFSYKEKSIFENFSLEISDNDKIWLHGESGCGKTTLLRLILGLENPSHGEIIKDKNLKFSAVFQENRLLPFRTALQNIRLIGADKETAIENLTALGLADIINKPVSELSGGMKRRVAVARALSVPFDCLILDEAFTGLDDHNTELTVNRILKIAKNKTIILVTHSKSVAKLFSAKEVKL